MNSCFLIIYRKSAGFFKIRKCTNKILIRMNEIRLIFWFYVAKYVFEESIRAKGKTSRRITELVGNPI